MSLYTDLKYSLNSFVPLYSKRLIYIHQFVYFNSCCLFCRKQLSFLSVNTTKKELYLFFYLILNWHKRLSKWGESSFLEVCTRFSNDSSFVLLLYLFIQNDDIEEIFDSMKNNANLTCQKWGADKAWNLNRFWCFIFYTKLN